MIDSEEAGLLSLAKVSPEDLRRNRKLLDRTGNRLGGPPSVVTWFLPQVDHALKGGVRTVFIIAQHLSQKFGTLNQFVIVGYGSAYPDTSPLALSLRKHFLDLKFTTQPFRTKFDDPDLLPGADCAISTLWTTAYVCARYQKVRAKFYLVQDIEPLFYAAGSVSAVIEHTYRFGFAMIANTRGVAVPLGRYTRDITQFCPGVDASTFFPDKSKTEICDPFRIVFYGRPKNARNCFTLGIEILRNVKEQLGNEVDIVSVGAEWDPKSIGMEGAIRNLGLLTTMKEVAELYRMSDLGLVLMTTPHPSYQPFEYMACGCVTATNLNESTSWLLNEQTSLLLRPIPSLAASQICELARNPTQWKSLRGNAIKRIKDMSWSPALKEIVRRICT